jgi:hypothetical protein
MGEVGLLVEESKRMCDPPESIIFEMVDSFGALSPLVRANAQQ